MARYSGLEFLDLDEEDQDIVLGESTARARLVLLQAVIECAKTDQDARTIERICRTCSEEYVVVGFVAAAPMAPDCVMQVLVDHLLNGWRGHIGWTRPDWAKSITGELVRTCLMAVCAGGQDWAVEALIEAFPNVDTTYSLTTAVRNNKINVAKILVPTHMGGSCGRLAFNDAICAMNMQIIDLMLPHVDITHDENASFLLAIDEQSLPLIEKLLPHINMDYIDAALMRALMGENKIIIERILGLVSMTPEKHDKFVRNAARYGDVGVDILLQHADTPKLRFAAMTEGVRYGSLDVVEMLLKRTPPVNSSQIERRQPVFDVRLASVAWRALAKKSLVINPNKIMQLFFDRMNTQQLVTFFDKHAPIGVGWTEQLRETVSFRVKLTKELADQVSAKDTSTGTTSRLDKKRAL